MDFLDILRGRYNQTFTGKYYDFIPESIGAQQDVEPVGVPFDYELVDVNSRAYKQLIHNLSDQTAATAAIKSCEALPWKNGGYVVLADGGLYRIVSINTDVTAARREAARLLSFPIGIEHVIRLVEIDNPRGIR